MQHGEAGTAKRWLVRAALQPCMDTGVRVVLCPSSELSQWTKLTAILRLHPRARFVVVVDAVGGAGPERRGAALLPLLYSVPWPLLAMAAMEGTLRST